MVKASKFVFTRAYTKNSFHIKGNTLTPRMILSHKPPKKRLSKIIWCVLEDCYETLSSCPLLKSSLSHNWRFGWLSPKIQALRLCHYVFHPLNVSEF